MLASSGESGPPCGVPSSLGSKVLTDHHARAQVAADQREQPLVAHPLATRAIRMSCWTLSKNFAKSRSTAMR